MIVQTTSLPGVLRIEPKVFGDDRGFFMESWNLSRYREAGIADHFVQSNLSASAKGVLRGLHYQWPKPQSKLVFVVEGEVFDVAVDIRKGSPHYGQWYGTCLSGENKAQLYLPAGFAHGFCVLSERAVFGYYCGEEYDAEADAGIAWNDPQVGVEWPVDNPLLSTKDQQAPLLAQANPLPVYSDEN